MPGISTGTVVRWKLVAQDTKDEFVKHESDKEVSAYVREDGDDADVSAILGKYIVDAVEKEGEDPIVLLKLARDGLLRVVGIKRARITPPPARVTRDPIELFTRPSSIGLAEVLCKSPTHSLRGLSGVRISDGL